MLRQFCYLCFVWLWQGLFGGMGVVQERINFSIIFNQNKTMGEVIYWKEWDVPSELRVDTQALSNIDFDGVGSEEVKKYLDTANGELRKSPIRLLVCSHERVERIWQMGAASLNPSTGVVVNVLYLKIKDVDKPVRFEGGDFEKLISQAENYLKSII